ncbi:uncharacterized protein V6R79_021746 [Siganus canaliculatus]
MESVPTNSGLPSALAGGNNAQQPSCMWRPWDGKDERPASQNVHVVNADLSAPMHSKAPQVVHPVKLLWPKSKCYDYLFRDAEMLLRNYPVQATICVYDDSSSDEDSDDEEEEAEKEMN